ncbi:MAG TPA: DUF5615 family PIN-like protein [Blastocatellia bacterium]|jgi:hypothetical protein|nr:DUF5615 family PIN-like protein [Blastocatellia bacterium]
MVRFFADQNFDGDIVRGLLRRIPDLDIVTAHQAGLSEAPDLDLLEWAANHERVIVTHDKRTMPDHAGHRIRTNLRMCGLVVVPMLLPLRQAIEEIELIAKCSQEGEWENRVQFLPL